MSEDDFFRFCQMNETFQFERDHEGNIICMPLTGLLSSNFNAVIATEFGSWLRQNHIDGIGFGPSAGFTLPNGAVRSPDVAWLNQASWDAMSRDDQEQFGHVCPDFVIEIRSECDSLRYLQDKMQEYIDNGCRLGWLIDRYKERVYVYQPGQNVVQYDSLDIQLSGEPLFPGFVLDLSAFER